jgi:hypothetical protein
VPFLLKDLKKREQILAKLATLPNDWTTYIPCIEVAPLSQAQPLNEWCAWDMFDQQWTDL